MEGFVTYSNEFRKYFGFVPKFDAFLSLIRDEARFDLYDFDEWLHSKFGDYEEEQQKSMLDIVKEHYSEEACKFCCKAFGLPEDMNI